MSRIKSKNTSLELMVRQYLWRKGFRYRLNCDLPGKPDIVFPGKKVAIFVNGCFWHNHGCKLSRLPKTNTDFWFAKLSANRERDEANRKKLRGKGWDVIDLWQCELNKTDGVMGALAEKLKEL